MKKYLDQDGTKHLVRKLDESITSKLQNKQDKLIAGVNIKIDGNTISSTASYDDKQIRADLDKKVNKPTDGSRFLTDKDLAFHPSYSKPNAPVFLANELWLTPHPQFQPKQVWTEFNQGSGSGLDLSLIHISEPTRRPG